jgi:hypothetical protein
VDAAARVGQRLLDDGAAPDLRHRGQRTLASPVIRRCWNAAATTARARSSCRAHLAASTTERGTRTAGGAAFQCTCERPAYPHPR